MYSVIKKFNRILEKEQKKKILILLCMMLIGAFLEALGVSMMLPLITVIMQPEFMASNEMVIWVCNLFNIYSHKSFAIACIVSLIVIFIVKDLFLIFQYYMQARFVCNNRFATQRKLLCVYIQRPYEYYLNAQSGEIIRVIQEDVTHTYELLTTLLGFWTESIVALVLIITIFLIDPFMTSFVAVMMLIIMLLITKAVKPVLRREGLLAQKHSALTNKWLLQAINGIKEVKVAHREEFFEENYERSGRVTIQAERKRTVLYNVPRLLIEMVSVCSVLALIAIMIYSGREAKTLFPSLGAFAMAAVKLMPSANRIVGALNMISYQEPALDKLMENLLLLDEGGRREKCVQEECKESLELKKEILLKNVSYSYPNSTQKVLDGAQMVIPVGKSVGIVGTSGAGKTTAVDILLGLLLPQEGMVTIDGKDVMSAYEEWLAHIGYIPQSIFMLDDTIRANVAFGLGREEQLDEKVWHALEEAQLAEFVRSLPKGLDTEIGERGIRLSGGQRQRIGIARALYHDPELLVFDEATSALDNETEAAIMESINNLFGRKTMLIIAHRLQTIAGCDMVYRVKDGKIERER